MDELHRPGIDAFKILVQRKRGDAHREVAVEIDWNDITAAELRILARIAITHNIMTELRKSTGPMPEIVKLKAFDQVHREPPCLVQYQPKKAKMNDPNVDDDLTRLLKNLTPEEQKRLLT